MNSLKKYVDDIMLKGKKYTMLGIGPMSKDLVYASLELSKLRKFPIMFIASRNQVDADCLGCGYVNNWDAYRFVNDIKSIANSIEYNGDYYICRDHGGPWQRDKERIDALERGKAMEIAKKSFEEDIKAGFNLLHIDPTKIPNIKSKNAPINDVIDMSIELIRFCERTRVENSIGQIYYEVGTEETNGGLTEERNFEYFIETLRKELVKYSLPLPLFIVGQTGTLVKMNENVGYFDKDKARTLSNIAKKYGIGFKEHNCDYIPEEDLSLHPAFGVTASNVAPEFGHVETQTLLDLINIEEYLFNNHYIGEKSNLYDVLLQKSIESNRWKKWLIEGDENINLNDSDVSRKILQITGHYTFYNSEILERRKNLYQNLANGGINGQRLIVNNIQKSIFKYVSAFNLINSSI